MHTLLIATLLIALIAALIAPFIAVWDAHRRDWTRAERTITRSPGEWAAMIMLIPGMLLAYAAIHTRAPRRQS